jgi:hypothetical protein
MQEKNKTGRLILLCFLMQILLDTVVRLDVLELLRGGLDDPEEYRQSAQGGDLSVKMNAVHERLSA